MKLSSGKINGFKLYSAYIKLEEPISDSTHTLNEISFLVLRISTEAGITGESYLLSFQYSPNAIRGALKDMLPLLLDYEVHQTGKISKLFDDVAEYFGRNGINRWVRSLVNIALWDARGRMLGQPVHRLFGVHGEAVKVYGSGGWLSYSTEKLVAEATGYVARGFRSIKIKVGSPDWRTDLQRIREVRKAIGNDIDIMIDANQGMDISSACQLAEAIRDLRIAWFEEPLHHLDFDGYKALKNQSGIPLAMGEREYDQTTLRELINRRAIDIWQPDILRIGGVDDWRRSAALAEAYHIPVLPHYYKDYDLPLLTTIPNGTGAESFDWIDSLIDNPMEIRDGMGYPRNTPGWGFNFLDKYLTEINL